MSLSFVRTTFFALLLLLGAMSQAFAAWNAFATVDLNLRSGPGTNYPVVLQIPRWGVIVLYQCIRPDGWCEVSFAGVRGWAYGRYLTYGLTGPQVAEPPPLFSWPFSSDGPYAPPPVGAPGPYGVQPAPPFLGR